MEPVRLASSRLVERAKLLLLAAEGLSNTEIAGQVGCSRPTVILWRDRYPQAGLDGLVDKPRSGRPQTVRADRRAEILAATLTPPPEHLGQALSTRLLGDELGVSPTPWPASGATTTSSPGGLRPSSSPPTRSWKPRSATSSACTYPT